MNFKKLVSGLGMGLVVSCGLLLAACSTMPPASNAAETPTKGDVPASGTFSEESADYLRAGQKISVEFTDVPGNPVAMSQTIREDGLINLPYGVTLKAAGLNRGQLIEQIQKAYVPKYYKRLSVNVKSDELYFSVGGEVKNPSQRPYLGQTTVLQAIQSAGDYTDFANKKKIQITRTNGKKFTVNGLKAAQDRSLDLPIYPGDRIIVPRRLF
jgi:protein involved in polysaccharide export with SLBB domain